MTTVTEDHEWIDDDQDSELREVEVEQSTEPADSTLFQLSDRPPPIATDFSRVTTRFEIFARDWTRMNRPRALDALRRAIAPWDGVFWLTFWPWRGYHPFTGTAGRPGHGEERQTTIDLYGKWLASGSRGTYPKGQAVSTTLARSRYHGHSDDECTLRSGILMDSDECGGWEASRALCRDVGLAFVAQMRPVDHAWPLYA